MIKHERWIIQVTHNIPIFSFHINYICVHFILYMLERLSLEAPCEYVHPGLVLRLDWASCQPLPYSIFFVCLRPPRSLLLGPTIHISHVFPPLTTRWLNTVTQVNNMGMLHFMHNGHTYTSHNYYYSTLPSYFFYIYSWAGWMAPTTLAGNIHIAYS